MECTRQDQDHHKTEHVPTWQLTSASSASSWHTVSSRSFLSLRVVSGDPRLSCTLHSRRTFDLFRSSIWFCAACSFSSLSRHAAQGARRLPVLILRCCAMQPVPTWRVAVAISVTHHWLLATTSDAMAFSPRKREDWLDPLIDVCRRNRALVKRTKNQQVTEWLGATKRRHFIDFFLASMACMDPRPGNCFRNSSESCFDP